MWWNSDTLKQIISELWPYFTDWSIDHLVDYLNVSETHWQYCGILFALAFIEKYKHVHFYLIIRSFIKQSRVTVRYSMYWDYIGSIIAFCLHFYHWKMQACTVLSKHKFIHEIVESHRTLFYNNFKRIMQDYSTRLL